MINRYEDIIGPRAVYYLGHTNPEQQKYVREMHTAQEAGSLRVTLSIRHDTLAVEEISSRLQLEPSSVMRRGDKIARQVRSDATYWSLSSEDEIQRNRFEEHLGWMLEQLFGRLPAIRKLQEENAQFRLYAHIEPGFPVIDTCLDVETTQRLAQLRIPLDFIIVYRDWQDEGSENEEE